MFKRKFYRCDHCGNLFDVVDDAGVTPICCGESMRILEPNTTDGAAEKHVPVIERNGDKVVVKVGSAPHPMLQEHYIQWVAVVQEDRIQFATLKPGATPEATFALADANGPITAYEYCNLHGLWVAESA
ncbi:MAG: desulfoferrodoxin [Clostridiales Family XIII bacterium]|jgi:superoxide reductase|nr:desulfoferrodoxin [Clostridiales Family XIII bacterium]